MLENNLGPDFFHSGYFDPHGRTRSPQQWTLLDTFFPHNPVFTPLPAPGAVIEEAFDPVLSNLPNLQVHTVVVQQGDQIDLVQSFFHETDATKLATTIDNYSSEDVKVTVKTSELVN